jgi:hypothetical protein
MTDAYVKPPKPTDTIPAEQVKQERNDEAAALPPASNEALEAAFELIGDEMVRREVLARRAGDADYARKLVAGLKALLLAEDALDKAMRRNDFLREAEDLREELAELPSSDPDTDDPWVLKQQ